MGLGGKSEGEKRDFDGLRLVWDFGWLRPQELGRMLWPDAQHSTKYAERLARKWQEKGYVLARPLPDHNGTAIVLSSAGAAFLEQRGVPARSGKDFGETDGGKWLAPLQWRHDLLAAGLLSLLVEQGAEVIPEKRLRRENPGLKKYPDGLIFDNRGRATWLEVERARKTGGYLDDLAAALIQVAAGEAPEICGHKPTIAAIAAAEGGSAGLSDIDHEKRVRSALQRHAEAEMRLVVFRLTMKGSGVSSFEHDSHLVEPDSLARLLARVEKYGWETDPETGQAVTVMDGLEGRTWQDSTGWRFSVWDFNSKPVTGAATSITEAKRGMARAMLGWPSSMEVDPDLD